MQMIEQFFGNESAATGIEYAVVAALVSVACITAISTVGATLLGFYTAITTALAAAI
jgi:pilus assembly protein Flp/PilA